MFKRDLSDLILVPVYAGNLETASEFRSLFAGSVLAYGYLILRHTFSRNTLSIAMMLTRRFGKAKDQQFYQILAFTSLYLILFTAITIYLLHRVFKEI